MGLGFGLGLGFGFGFGFGLGLMSNPNPNPNPNPNVAHRAGQREVEDAGQRDGLARDGELDVDLGADAQRRYGGDEEEREVRRDRERHE